MTTGEWKWQPNHPYVSYTSIVLKNRTKRKPKMGMSAALLLDRSRKGARSYVRPVRCHIQPCHTVWYDARPLRVLMLSQSWKSGQAIWAHV
jgi:hypothetical protein